MVKLGDFIESKGNKDVDLIIQEVSSMKQLRKVYIEVNNRSFCSPRVLFSLK